MTRAQRGRRGPRWLHRRRDLYAAHGGAERERTEGRDQGSLEAPLQCVSKNARAELEFEQVHDLLAFRIFVDDLGACYTASASSTPSTGTSTDKLKDYIAHPKSNGYQSLHTVVIGPGNRQIEIQIRTHHMHEVAENGIAAHWRYKEGHLALSREDVQKVIKLRELFEAAREVEDPAEFLETVKVDLFAAEAFAFTPRGDVKFFPLGATALDFAYAIHTEVGNRCTGIKVNGRMVPLPVPAEERRHCRDSHPRGPASQSGLAEIAKTGRIVEDPP